MRTIAVSNQKGGVGKTTTAVNLGAALAEAGERVLLLDLDAQASATRWLCGQPGESELLEMFTEGRAIETTVLPTKVDGLSVVPGSPALGRLERVMAGEPGAEHVLAQAVAQLAGWDYVLVDCPPALGLASVSALVACGEVLVPVAARAMEVYGLADLMSSVERVRARLNPQLRVMGVLACQFDARTKLAAEVLGALRRRFGDLVFRTVVRQNVRLAEAPSACLPVTMFAPISAPAVAFRLLAEEVAAR